MWDIQLFKLNFDDRELSAVSDVITGGWLSMGEKIISFDKIFSLLTYLVLTLSSILAFLISVIGLSDLINIPFFLILPFTV